MLGIGFRPIPSIHNKKLKQLSQKGIHMATVVITTNVTRRLDRLQWSRFHTMVTALLGIGWLLDAFEVNIVGSVLGVIQTVFHLDAGVVRSDRIHAGDIVAPERILGRWTSSRRVSAGRRQMARQIH